MNCRKKYYFIDIFAGAGGLSEGFIQSGFIPVAHVEKEKNMCDTLKTRMIYHYLKKRGKLDHYFDYLSGKISRDNLINLVPNHILDSVICETMSAKSLPLIFNKIDEILRNKGIKTIDVLVGGPPCQAYSLVGRAQSNHMDVPMEEDPRNNLYKLYALFLKKYKPTMFVFENVMGIKTANKGKTWKNLRKRLKSVGYEIECKEQNSNNFGVLQNRRRMIIVGWLKESNLHYPSFKYKTINAIVNDLFYDLPKLLPGESCNSYSKRKPKPYIIDSNIRNKRDVLTLHSSRKSNHQDEEIYKKAIRLWDKEHKKLNYNDLPETLKSHINRTSFTDRFKVVEGNESCCHTVLAHLSKDGHYFIHPDINQHRSITTREAARIQSFPDNYYFEGSRSSVFTQIGNAVPPLMSLGIARGIKELLDKQK